MQPGPLPHPILSAPRLRRWNCRSRYWVSPRGPMSIDPATREVVQNIYIRKVERVDGELYNVEFKTIPNFKDPSKAKN